MTPAINVAKKAKIVHTVYSYVHDAKHQSYGMEAAEKLGIAAERVFKTLVVAQDNGQLAVAVLPVSNLLNLKLMAKALNAKKITMADPQDVQRSTGYVLGGVSPLGQKKRLKTIIDISAQDFSSIFVSAGRRGLEIELKLADLEKILAAKCCQIVQ